jgi:hypothetical protein
VPGFSGKDVKMMGVRNCGQSGGSSRRGQGSRWTVAPRGEEKRSRRRRRRRRKYTTSGRMNIAESADSIL